MLRKANAVLSLFTPDTPELAVVEIAERLKRPRSTVYRILATMAETGFLDQDPNTGRYRIGMHLATLGELARQSTSLQRLVHPMLLHLSEATEEMSTLMVPNGDEGVTVDVIESFHPLKIPGHLGGRFPLHATAGGKVLLAWRPPAEIERVLKQPLRATTPKTITSPIKLMRELEATRRQGYGVSRGEWLEDIFAVAAPVRDHRGRVVAALAVASPPSRWKPAHIKAMREAVVRCGLDANRAMGGGGAGGAGGSGRGRSNGAGPIVAGRRSAWR
jgi:DNA-binding IclR family transcriptional regulator